MYTSQLASVNEGSKVAYRFKGRVPLDKCGMYRNQAKPSQAKPKADKITMILVCTFFLCWVVSINSTKMCRCL
jgi:hypothetical protein